MSNLPEPTSQGSAIISEDGLYRYRLERTIPDNPTGQVLTVIMINPSTASADLDDPTIRRLKGFAHNYGCDKLIVGNLFAHRSPDVKTLAKVEDPIGPDNWRHLSIMMEEAKRGGRIVVGFGAYSKIPKAHRDVITKLRTLADIHEVTLWCWGTNADGSPKHPLYIPNAKGLEPWL